ncbi:MAG TPA: aldehyde dehydrogenase family protein [Candidatus Nanopelagicales bacterium]|nr:aldehyde dehydrogenase family protein [Candidatus Nanopelagicales bacterium]
MSVDSDLDTASLDATVETLRAAAPAWAALPLAEKIAMLDRLRPRILAESDDMVAAIQRAKGIDPSTVWGAEDWLSMQWAFLQGVNSLLLTLRRIEKGEPPLALDRAYSRPDGQTVVKVFPSTVVDRLLLSGYSAEVWMQPGVTPAQAVDSAASPYRGRGFADPGVWLVLGAGNLGSITTFDILHVLYTEGSVAVVKMNPVNDYLSPFFARIFQEFVDAGWLRFVHGGGALGSYLAYHDEVDAVHMTGHASTHDAIVWGRGEEGAARKKAGTPLLTKPMTSELGGISPLIVVPGDWSDADLQYQAEHIVTSKLNNSGHNCIGTQVVVLPETWDRADALLDRVRAVMRSLPPRSNYYPSSAENVAAAAEGHEAEEFDVSCVLVPDLDATKAESLFVDEVFAGALGVVRLPGDGVEDYLVNAVAFANDVLPGNLGATIVVSPETEKQYAAAVDRAIADMRFGSVGVNIWSAVAFLLGYTPWGAFPGDTLDDVRSGIGVVHNTFMLERTQKSVARMPFRPLHRALLKGHLHMSPKPPFFVTNKTGETTARRLAEFLATDKPLALPGVFASALRG